MQTLLTMGYAGMDFSLFPITYQQIVVFLTVAEEGGFAKAAAKLHISQPAISKNIAKLESLLNLQLFTRTTRDVALTNGGRQLYESWAPLFDEFSRSYRTTLAMQKENDDHLDIGLVNSIHPEKYFNKILHRFREENPDIRIILKAQNIQRLEASFLGGDFDLIFLPDFERFWAIDNGFSLQWVARSYATVVMSEKHPLASKGTLTTKDLVDCVFHIPSYLVNNNYSQDLKERFAPYNRFPKTVSVFESAHDAQLLFSHDNSELMFLDSFFDFHETAGIVRLPVIDQKNGIICVWKPQQMKPSLNVLLNMYIDSDIDNP